MNKGTQVPVISQKKELSYLLRFETTPEVSKSANMIIEEWHVIMMKRDENKTMLKGGIYRSVEIRFVAKQWRRFIFLCQNCCLLCLRSLEVEKILGVVNVRRSFVLEEVMIKVTKSSQLHHQTRISKTTNEAQMDKFGLLKEEHTCLVKI